MTATDKTMIYKTALNTFGIVAQTDVLIEEMAELTQALIHDRRRRETNIAEEIADVEIMLEQIKTFYGLTREVNVQKQKKLQRLSLILQLRRLDGDRHDT